MHKKIKLRNWQSDAFLKWLDAKNQGIVSVVTGGGKTIFGLYCANYLLEENLIKSVLIIVPTKTLQDQWASTILSVFNLSRDEINFDWKKKLKYNIIVNISAQKIDYLEYSKSTMLILDECHRYGIISHKPILEGEFVSKLGLTATLERKYDNGVDEFLKPNIGDVIYKYGYKKALKDNVISNYELTNVRTYFNPDEKEAYSLINNKIAKLIAIVNNLKKEGSDGDLYFFEEKLKLLMIKRSRLVNNTEQRIIVATKIILENFKRKKIIFCESILQAEIIKNSCYEMGLSTSIYHSQMRKSTRIQKLVNFQTNMSSTLIGCKSLDEGFDVPDIDFGVIVSQTKSSRQRIQRLGRTIRKTNKRKKAQIFTLFTTPDEREILFEEMLRNPQIKINWLDTKTR